MNPYIRKFSSLLTTSLISVGATLGQTLQKPNIIMFLVDDMGWQDTSVPFWEKATKYNHIYETPNMEKLAREGIKFTQAYAYAISSPTRTSLMTGMNVARHRVTSWTTYKDKPSDQQDETLTFPSWNYNGLQPRDGVINNTFTATTLPQILQQNGYRTIHCGKGHFGADQTKGANPLSIGFDVNIGGGANGQPGSYTPNQAGIYTNGNPIFDVKGIEKYGKKGLFLTEALTQRAKEELQKTINEHKPFYLYMAHYAVHTPIQQDNRFYQKYVNKGLGHLEAAYASLIEGMDKSLGDLMQWLDENNLTDNTIIIFMSDNGGLSQHSRGNDRPAHTHNLPLNSGKASAYEGGIRVPMIVKWKGTTVPNTQTDQKVIIEDFFPTILEMADVKNYETTQTVDGRSFVPTLKNESQEEKDLFWHFPNKSGSGPGIGTYSSIRSGDYKLIYWWKNQSFELFNIKKDIGEKKNLIYDTEQKQRIQELVQKLTIFLKNANAQRPTFKSNRKIALWPNEVEIKVVKTSPNISNTEKEYWYYIKNNGNNNRNIKALKRSNETTSGVDVWSEFPLTKYKVVKNDTEDTFGIVDEYGHYLQNDGNPTNFIDNPFKKWTITTAKTIDGHAVCRVGVGTDYLQLRNLWYGWKKTE